MSHLADTYISPNRGKRVLILRRCREIREYLSSNSIIGGLFMRAVTRRGWYMNLLLVAALLVGLSAAEVQAQDTAMKDGGTEPGPFYLGMRACFAPLTQK